MTEEKKTTLATLLSHFVNAELARTKGRKHVWRHLEEALGGKGENKRQVGQERLNALLYQSSPLCDGEADLIAGALNLSAEQKSQLESAPTRAVITYADDWVSRIGGPDDKALVDVGEGLLGNPVRKPSAPNRWGW
jgi:hypothetical protein